MGLREKKTLGKCFDLIVLYGKKIVLGRTIVPMVHVFLWRGGGGGCGGLGDRYDIYVNDEVYMAVAGPFVHNSSSS